MISNALRMSASYFYAIASGKTGPQITSTWAECSALVSGHQGAIFKKFKTRDEAIQFISSKTRSSIAHLTSQSIAHLTFQSIASSSHSSSLSSSSPIPRPKRSFGTSSLSSSSSAFADSEASPLFAGVLEDNDESVERRQRQRTTKLLEDSYVSGLSSSSSSSDIVVVYTDGACPNNGKASGARGGVGVYWGTGDKRNVAEPLEGLVQTNNRAELTAILRALETANRDKIEQTLEIRTDSQYSIKIFTEWIIGWKRRSWKKSDGEPVENVDLIQAIEVQLTERRGKYRFVHVRGHAGEPGNEAADLLARMGAGSA